MTSPRTKRRQQPATPRDMFTVFFDAEHPMGLHVLGDGIIELVNVGGSADQAGVTAKHVITAVNDGKYTPQSSPQLDCLSLTDCL